MRKDEFLRRLEQLLGDISAEEREEAMAFYRSYFEDAGEANEARIIAELESPENVAEIIKGDLGMVTVNEQPEGNYEQKQQSYGSYADSQQAQQEKRNHDIKIVILVVIIGLLTSPVWLGVLTGVLGTIFGLAVALVAITFAMFAVGVVFVGLGIAMMAGLGAAIVSIPVGLAFTGSGLIILALALLLLLLCVAVFGKFLPWVCKGIVNICKKPFAKKEAQTA